MNYFSRVASSFTLFVSLTTATAPVSAGDVDACTSASEETFQQCAAGLVNELITEHQFPGFSIGIVKGRELVYSGSFGVANRASAEPITADTVFQIGSVTKMFTGLLFALMVEDGTVKLGDRLSDYLPEDVKVPTDANEGRITLQHLATHTSGLPRYPANLERVDGDPILGFSEQELYRGLRESELVFPVATAREYSNFGYGLLAHALERAAGEPYDRLLHRYILDPLAMRSTGITLGASQQEKLATAYRDDDPNIATSPWDMGALSGAGGLFSSVADLARFTGFQIMPGADELGPHTLAALGLQRTPFYRYTQQTNVAYGFGAFVVDWEKQGAELILHNGDLDGYAGHIRFSPDLQLGVIVLTNSGIGQHVGELANALMNASIIAYGRG